MGNGKVSGAMGTGYRLKAEAGTVARALGAGQESRVKVKGKSEGSTQKQKNVESFERSGVLGIHSRANGRLIETLGHMVDGLRSS